MIRHALPILTGLLLAILNGAAMADLPQAAPEGVPMTVEQRVAALMIAAAEDINRLAGNATADLFRNPESRSAAWRQSRAAELELALRVRAARVGVDLSRVLGPAATEATKQAALRADRELSDMGLGERTILGSEGGPGRVGFVNINAEAVDVIARDTAARETARALAEMGRAAEAHAANAGQVFRTLSRSVLQEQGRGGETAVNTAIARGILSGDPRITDRAIREIFADPNSPEAESYRQLGNRQITVGKATMSVAQYAATVTRTRMREATVAARHERLGSLGVNLVQITGRQSDNFCTAFVGLVCSLDGFSGEVGGVTVIPLDSLPGGGPPFHPNCSKGTAAYIPDLVSAERRQAAAEAVTTVARREREGTLLRPMNSRAPARSTVASQAARPAPILANRPRSTRASPVTTPAGSAGQSIPSGPLKLEYLPGGQVQVRTKGRGWQQVAVLPSKEEAWAWMARNGYAPTNQGWTK